VVGDELVEPAALLGVGGVERQHDLPVGRHALVGEGGELGRQVLVDPADRDDDGGGEVGGRGDGTAGHVHVPGPELVRHAVPIGTPAGVVRPRHHVRG
jgi:hypothetical protein